MLTPPPRCSCPLARRALQHALRQDADDVPLVLRRPALVGDRRAGRGGERAGAGEQLVRRRARPTSAASASREVMSPPTAASAIPARAIVAVARASSAAPAATTAQSPTRRSTFSYALPAPARSGTRISTSISAGPTAVSYGPAVELVHVDDALAVRAADDHPRADRRADGGQVLGRVGLAERAADRAAVADDRVGDHALGVGEDRQPRRRAGRTRAASRWRVIAPIRTSPSCSRT